MKQLDKSIDNWFLGYTRSVHSKSGSLHIHASHRPSKPLKSGTGLANLRAAALKKPEVMVKIPKRHSKNSKGMKGIKNHADYVSRNGNVPLENHHGEKLQGKQAIQDFLKDWQNLGIADETRHKEALNIVLSMPKNTPSDALLQAARDFAAEQFQGHQYFLGLHDPSQNPDEPEHPHVHLCVLMRDENGKRLNPRKNDLFEWRVRFAEKLRENGVDCAATKRVHRGQTQKAEHSTLRAMRQRGSVSQAQTQQLLDIAQAVKTGQRPQHPFLNPTKQTRQDIVSEYKSIARELYVRGYKTEAKIISQFAQTVSEKGFETQAQQKFDEIQSHFRQPAPSTPQIDEMDGDLER